MKKASQATPHNQQVAIIHTRHKKSVDGRDSSLATEEEAKEEEEVAKEEKEGTKHCF